MERLNPPPAPKGWTWRVRSPVKGAESLAEVFCILLHIFFGGVFYTPLYLPKRPAHSAGPPQKLHPPALFFYQNFNQFLASIFYRFLIVLGWHLGVIFGTFGSQVEPSSLQNAFWKLIFCKNVNFPQILRFPIRKRFVGPQDDLQNASRSAQDGSKTVLKSVFLDVKNNLNFCLVSGLVFHGF